MFGIGLPEMIVILAVALIVVGPEKLPDMARTVAKWVFELKKTVNQVKESLADEDNLIGSMQSDLKQTGNELKEKLLESDHFTWQEPGGPKNLASEEVGEVIDVEDVTEPLADSGEASAQDSAGQDKDDSAPDSASKS